MNKEIIIDCLKADNIIESLESAFGKLNDVNLSKYIEVSKAITQLKEYSKAKEILEAILSLYPKEAEALYLMANVCVAFSEPEDALKYFYTSMDMGCVNFQSLIGTAMVEKVMGNPEKVIELLQKSCDLDRSNPFPRQLFIAELFEQKKMHQVILMALELQSDFPDSYISYHYEFVAWIALEEYNQAYKSLSENLDRFKDNREFVQDYTLALSLIQKNEQAWDFLSTNIGIVDENSLKYLKLKERIANALNMRDEVFEANKKMYDNYRLEESALYLATALLVEKNVQEASVYIDAILNAKKKNHVYYSAVYINAISKSLSGFSETDVEQIYMDAIKIFEDAYEDIGELYLIQFAAECYGLISDEENEKKCREMLNANV